MSHLSIALIIVLAIIVIPLTLVIMHNHQIKKRKNSILFFFKNIGAVHDLSFTGQEILRDKVLGLDGPKRKVLIVEEKSGEFDAQMIDLLDVSSCKVKKIYSAIHSNEYRKNRPEDYLKSIAIEFGFRSGKAPVSVFFYKNEQNSVYEIPELEARTKRWETMLSSMLERRREKTA